MLRVVRAKRIMSLLLLRSSLVRSRPTTDPQSRRISRSLSALLMGVTCGGFGTCILGHSNQNQIESDGETKLHVRRRLPQAAVRHNMCLCEGSRAPHEEKRNGGHKKIRARQYHVESHQLFPPIKSSCLSSQNKPRKTEDLSNRILLMSNVLSTEECQLLMNDADHVLGGSKYNRDLIEVDEDDKEGAADERRLRRVSLCDMSQSSQKLSHDLIFCRILPALRQNNPELLESLGLSRFDVPLNEMDWASDEPSINRYEVGGRFDPHRDGYAMTVIVLLSTDEAFLGGGTRFFDSAQFAEAFMDGNCSDDTDSDSSVVVKPPQGTVVLFSGDIYHAGCPVTKGTRHLFVASFSPKENTDS